MSEHNSEKLQKAIEKVSRILIEQYSQKLYRYFSNLNQRLSVNASLLPGFARTFTQLTESVKKYESKALQQEALNVIPVDEFQAIAESLVEEQDRNQPEVKYSYQDFLVKEALRWFKEDFFKWVNKDECPFCNNSDQDKLQLVANDRGNVQEQQEGQASNVEIYKCLKCGKTHRFPRYDNPATLLYTRKGRCGEYANCFYLVLKALGVNVRYIWNKEDHVWTEYYSENFQKWIHLDSCENCYNEPLLYCNNWCKSMSYVVGVNPNGIVDLSKKYIDPKSDRQLPRTLASERSFAALIRLLDIQSKAKIADRKELYHQLIADRKEKQLFNDPKKLYDNTLTHTNGRVSGSDEWKKSRGESGI